MSTAATTWPANFKRTSRAEQIHLVQELWDWIAQHADEVPILESHLRVAESRLHEYRGKPDPSGDARELLRRLRSKQP